STRVLRLKADSRISCRLFGRFRSKCRKSPQVCPQSHIFLGFSGPLQGVVPIKPRTFPQAAFPVVAHSNRRASSAPLSSEARGDAFIFFSLKHEGAERRKAQHHSLGTSERRPRAA